VEMKRSSAFKHIYHLQCSHNCHTNTYLTQGSPNFGISPSFFFPPTHSITIRPCASRALHLVEGVEDYRTWSEDIGVMTGSQRNLGVYGKMTKHDEGSRVLKDDIRGLKFFLLSFSFFILLYLLLHVGSPCLEEGMM
jgi:hypothetical protein